jgi:hypothetical protein
MKPIEPPAVEHRRILIVGQDNLFSGLPGCLVDHVSTGRTMTPHVGTARSTTSLTVALGKIAAGKYDLIALPAVDFRWAHDASLGKRWLRSLLGRVGCLRCVSGPVHRILSRKATKVIVLDRYDSHEVRVNYLRCVVTASFYFKTNLLAEDGDRVVQTGNGGLCRLKYLPYWLATENYQMPFQAHRDFDVFFAGEINSEERRAAVAAMRGLEAEGYRVYIASRRLGLQEYMTIMSRSWLTLSPQGFGYNGFRHYESMLVGSIPLINRSQPPILNDFVHGENCWLYSHEAQDIHHVARTALRDKQRLLRIAGGLRQFAEEHHSIRAVGRYLLNSVADGQMVDDSVEAPAGPHRRLQMSHNSVAS